MTDFVVVKIPDLTWGEPSIARAIGRRSDDCWGALSVLRETPWAPLFPVIPFDVFDQALRGHATPLMRILGPPPSALARRLPLAFASCRERSKCINAASFCVPGVKMPDCWEGDSIPMLSVGVASQVARYWRDGIAVIVLTPEE